MACVVPVLNKIPAISLTSDDLPLAFFLTEYLDDPLLTDESNLVWTLSGAPSDAVALDDSGCLTVTDTVTATNMKVTVTAKSSGASSQPQTLSVTVR